MKLYKIDNKNKLRILEIYAQDNKVIQKHGLVDGKLVVNESVCVGKNIGKSNETTPQQQAVLEAESKLKKKVDEGYVNTPEEASTQEVILPMLAKDYKKEFKKVQYPCYIQPKLDGMRALKSNNRLISRKGLAIETLPHLSAIVLGSDITIDGELYAHGLSFQENMKLIKKNRPESVNVKYHVYDMISDLPFGRRIQLLHEVVKDIKDIEVVETYIINSEEELKHFHSQFIQEGYEGTMVRWGTEGYQMDKRSSNLLKYKDFIDEVATIISIVPSEKRPEHAQFICEMNGKVFGCGMKFSHADRVEMLQNKENYIGEKAELRFFEYTDDGTPRFPVCIGIRLDR